MYRLLATLRSPLCSKTIMLAIMQYTRVVARSTLIYPVIGWDDDALLLVLQPRESSHLRLAEC